jgi:hypothetical protein
MAAIDREARLKREKGKATVRALHLSELEAAGAARARALAEADKQLDRVARLLPDALTADFCCRRSAGSPGLAGRRSTS